MTRSFSRKSSIYPLKISTHAGVQAPSFSPLWAAASPAGIRHFAFGVTQEEFLLIIARQGKLPEITFTTKPSRSLVQVIEYLEGKRTSFSIPIDDRGLTEFQRKVYQAVQEIPYGQTTTYGDLARRLERPRAARAVGAANAANPLPVIIPCHRLVGADGSLRGYGGTGGISTKRWLLTLEKRNAESWP